MIAAGGAIAEAALEIRAKALRIAAHVLDAPLDGLEVTGREIRSGGSSVTLARVFEIAIIGQGLPDGERPGLDATAHFEPPAAAFSYGSAAAVASVDPSTGDFTIERFVMVHDCGTPVNPMLIEGQVLGALAQGFGAATMEELRYDADTGQLMNGSMMDYFAPTAADLPPVELHHTETPSPVTPFGVRGVGEVGTIPSGAAIANAVCDALADLGVEISRLPITPESVWRAIQEAGRS
jgi:carbon-monoxide dehydrogenase large subunit